MNWKDEDLPALRELESALVAVWRIHPDMTDHVAARAYEAAFQLCRARARGHEPKAPALTGLDADAFNAVRDACEKILTREPAPMKNGPRGNVAPVPVEKLADYLRELRRSVERHTEQGGRQGYLTFVRGFLP